MQINTVRCRLDVRSPDYKVRDWRSRAQMNAQQRQLIAESKQYQTQRDQHKRTEAALRGYIEVRSRCR